MDLSATRAYSSMQLISTGAFRQTVASGTPAATAAAINVAETENSAASSTRVSISAEARQAAASMVVDDVSLHRALAADIVKEAETRLTGRRVAPGVGDGYLPSQVNNLPLLQENQELLERMHQEMRAIGNKLDDPELARRFNQLQNLSVRLQIQGWEKPMVEADVQRELDVAQAMGQITAQSSGSESSPAMDSSMFDTMAGWRQRWQQDQLEMPAVNAVPGRSMWLEMANKAGISDSQFMQTARDLAANNSGEALTQSIERYISSNYVAQQESAKKTETLPLAA